MPPPDPPSPHPDEETIFELLRKTGLGAGEAFTLFAGIREMASSNLIARFESKLDAKLDAVQSELKIQRWLMGLGFAALVAAAIAQLFRSAG